MGGLYIEKGLLLPIGSCCWDVKDGVGVVESQNLLCFDSDVTVEKD